MTMTRPNTKQNNTTQQSQDETSELRSGLLKVGFRVKVGVASIVLRQKDRFINIY